MEPVIILDDKKELKYYDSAQDASNGQSCYCKIFQEKTKLREGSGKGNYCESYFISFYYIFCKLGHWATQLASWAEFRAGRQAVKNWLSEYYDFGYWTLTTLNPFISLGIWFQRERERESQWSAPEALTWLKWLMCLSSQHKTQHAHKPSEHFFCYVTICISPSSPKSFHKRKWKSIQKRHAMWTVDGFDLSGSMNAWKLAGVLKHCNSFNQILPTSYKPLTWVGVGGGWKEQKKYFSCLAAAGKTLLWLQNLHMCTCLHVCYVQHSIFLNDISSVEQIFVNLKGLKKSPITICVHFLCRKEENGREIVTNSAYLAHDTVIM